VHRDVDEQGAGEIRLEKEADLEEEAVRELAAADRFQEGRPDGERAVSS